MSNDKATEIIEQLSIKTAETFNTLNECKQLLNKLDGTHESGDEDTRPTQPVIRVDSMQRTIKFMDGK